jgi:hypothetical protein
VPPEDNQNNLAPTIISKRKMRHVTADAENLIFFPWIPVLYRHVPGSIQNLKQVDNCHKAHISLTL